MRKSIIFMMGLGLSMIATATLAGGSVKAGKEKSGPCAACHGADGNSPSPAFPKIAGQSAGYIAKQLADFKSGRRANGIMAGQVAGLSKADMENLGAFYASQKTKTGTASSEKLVKTGARLYRGGNAKTGVSACMSCHGPSGKGIPPKYPSVSGQHAAYSEAQLNAFKDKKRKNDDNVMTGIAFRMSHEEIKAVSDYMAGLY
jgi:cytochrome c553